MEVVKINDNNYDNEIKLIEGTDSMIISRDREGDLSFAFFSESTKGNVRVFPITREDYQVYKAFENFYFSLINCDIYQVSEEDKEECLTDEDISSLEEETLIRNKILRDSSIYSQVMSSDVPTWYSNDDVLENANSLSLISDGDNFYVKFCTPNDFTSTCDVKVNILNNGKYNPFHLPFDRLYDDLESYDHNYHQVHFDELIKSLYR